MSRLLKLYHLAPYPARVIAASARGLYLRRWRYGSDTEKLVGEAFERESWSREQWDIWQQDRLGRVLHRAATLVPYYRQQWARRRRNGDRASWELLGNWPPLEKEALRQRPREFIAEGYPARDLFHEHTSGTSGTPLELWWTRAMVREHFALFEARWRRWYGVGRHDRWAMIGGQLVTPARRNKPPYWVWNAGARQLYLSAYHISDSSAADYVRALTQHRVRYVWGYTSGLFALADSILRLGLRAPRMAVAITNAEPVFAFQRETISAAFGCPVRETYGLAENVVAAGECEKGALHLWPEVGVAEVLEDDEPVPAGEMGELLGTGLLNVAMPLIRYRTGDRAALHPERDACACGRTLPRLAAVEGRSDDVLQTRDGRAVGRLDPAFKDRLPVREAQIIQETLDRTRVRFVPAPGGGGSMQTLVDNLRERLGDIEVVLEPVEAIPRGPGGKFRAVISMIPRRP